MRPVAAVAVCLVLVACAGDPDPDGARSAAPSPGASSEDGRARGARVFLPAPERAVPRRPARLARELVRTTRALRRSIELWVRDGAPRPPQRVVLQALYKQRMHRVVAAEPGLYRRTVARLPRGLQKETKALAAAAAKLSALVTPIDHPTQFETRRPPPAAELLRYYRKAQRRFGVDWEVLAAVNYIESKFGRVVSDSSAGAQGPMQFIPSTWEAYGMGGDVRDPYDAIIGAANYLRASGAPHDYRKALYAYNHSWAYVEAMLLYARQIMRDPRNYYVLYNFQVYVATTKGPVRITGPGV